MIFHSIVSMYDESEDDEMEIRMEKQKFGQYDCSSFILSEREQERIWRPWKSIVVVNLLGRKIGFKAMEARLKRMWVKKRGSFKC